MTVLITIALVAAVPSMAVAEEEGIQGGGVVNNVVPETTFLGHLAGGNTARTTGTDVLFGTVLDNNGEFDLKTLTLEVVLPDDSVETFGLDVSLVPWTGLEKPSEFTNDWKVWNNEPIRNGLVNFEFRYTYTMAGLYTFIANTTDASDETGLDDVLLVTVSDAVSLPDFVDRHGGVATLWGDWVANPGDAFVESNHAVVFNTGDFDDQEFTLTFQDGLWLGVLDVSWDFDLFDNLEFRCAEARAADDPVPDDAYTDGTWTAWTADLAGAATCAFTGGSSLGAGVMFVQYRLVDVPAPLLNQDYQASFTVSAPSNPQ